MKKKKKKKRIPKNPIVKWMCNSCHLNKSSKTMGHVINAITLKCSLCDEHLKLEMPFGADIGPNNYKDALAKCPKCTNAIKRPLCADCGNVMYEFDYTLEELKAWNPPERNEPPKVIIQKKPWWKV